MFGFQLTDIVILIVSILLAMSVHEATHAYVGLRLGDDTAAEEGRISLNPFKHIDPLMSVVLPVLTLVLFHAPILAARPVPFNPSRVRFGEMGSALISVAGPLSNLALAIVAALLLRFFADSAFVANALYLFITLNVWLFVFNLVPIPPLDGSRVLYAFAPEPVQTLLDQLEPFGLIIIFALVLLGGFGGVLLDVNNFVLNLLLS